MHTLSSHAKINESGRILIPLALRRELSLQTDDDVLLRIENDALVITPLRTSVAYLQEKVSQRNIHQRQLTHMLQNETFS